VVYFLGGLSNALTVTGSAERVLLRELSLLTFAIAYPLSAYRMSHAFDSSKPIKKARSMAGLFVYYLIYWLIA
jgi:hypothetical protein